MPEYLLDRYKCKQRDFKPSQNSDNVGLIAMAKYLYVGLIAISNCLYVDQIAISKRLYVGTFAISILRYPNIFR